MFICVYICIYIINCMYVYVYVYVCMCKFMFYVFVYVYVYVYVFVLLAFVCMCAGRGGVKNRGLYYTMEFVAPFERISLTLVSMPEAILLYDPVDFKVPPPTPLASSEEAALAADPQ